MSLSGLRFWGCFNLNLNEWLWSLWAEGGAVDNGFIVIHGKCPGSPLGELSTNP